MMGNVIYATLLVISVKDQRARTAFAVFRLGKSTDEFKRKTFYAAILINVHQNGHDVTGLYTYI